MIQPTSQGIQSVLSGFSPDEIRLCKSLLKAGSVLPEIISQHDETVRVSKVKRPLKGSLEEKIDNSLDQVPWLPPRKKSYHFAHESEKGAGARVPPFAKRIPNNQWSQILVRMIDRFGMDLWHWKLSKLNTFLSKETPLKGSRSDLRKFSLRSGKAYRSTSVSQRTGLADLKYSAKRLTDTQAAECIAKLLCRLTTLIYQNHLMAIESLQNMRVPLIILRDLEEWILSEEYGEYRDRIGSKLRVPLPISLVGLSTVLNLED
jgi:hypothetical protein